MGRDHCSSGIEGHGQRSRLGLGSQFETRSLGPRSSIEDSLIVSLVAFAEFDKRSQIFADQESLFLNENIYRKYRNAKHGRDISAVG